jgi:hypothetical protein
MATRRELVDTLCRLTDMEREDALWLICAMVADGRMIPLDNNAQEYELRQGIRLEDVAAEYMARE